MDSWIVMDNSKKAVIIRLIERDFKGLRLDSYTLDNYFFNFCADSRKNQKKRKSNYPNTKKSPQSVGIIR